MFEAPSSAAVAGLQSSIVAVLMLLLGYLAVTAVVGRREVDVSVRIALVLPAILAMALVLMLVHIATNGALFASPVAVRLITLVAFPVLGVAAWLRRPRVARSAAWPAVAAVVGVVALTWLVFGHIVFDVLPAGTGGDTALHMGWTGQLLNGERLPTNALVGPIENYYPWLFHGLLAWICALIPGGRAFHSLGVAQLLQITGAATALFGLGFYLWRRWYHGLACAVLGALTAGFGFLSGEELEFEMHVRGPETRVGRFYGDLVGRRPHSIALHNGAPVYPRELAYSLLPAILLLFALALRTKSKLFMVAAGVLVGIVGLTGGEALIAAAVMTLVFIAMAGPIGRFRAALLVGIPAAAVYSIWLVPLMINFFKHDGFVDLSSLPIVLSPLQVLGAWGIVTPFALVGLVLMITRFRTDDGSRLALIHFISMGLLLAFVVWVTARLTGGFETLGRPHRYWPIFSQAACIVGGFGVAWIIERIARFNVIPAVLLSVALLYPALVSSWYGSRSVPDVVHFDPVLVASLEGDPDTWLNKLSPRPGERCVAAIPGWLSNKAFSYSGFRMAWYVWTKPRRNSARVRWADFYSISTPDIDRRADVARLTEGIGPRELWEEVVDLYGVDRIVVPQRFAGSPVYEGERIEPAEGPRGRPISIVYVDDCGDADSKRLSALPR